MSRVVRLRVTLEPVASSDLRDDAFDIFDQGVHHWRRSFEWRAAERKAIYVLDSKLEDGGELDLLVRALVAGTGRRIQVQIEEIS